MDANQLRKRLGRSYRGNRYWTSRRVKVGVRSRDRPVAGKVPSCPLLIVKSIGVSNSAASTEVSNRGYKCVLASPNASRCLPTSSPNCLRFRLFERASTSASSSVSTAPPLVCASAQGNWQSAAANTQVIADRRTFTIDSDSPHSAAIPCAPDQTFGQSRLHIPQYRE